jgi:hypothetical protein
VAYSDPRTWSPGETVTSALLNAQLRDNMNALAERALIVQFGAVGNGVIQAGSKVFIYLPASVTFAGWTVVGDGQVGSIVLDVWADTLANFIAGTMSAADTIAGSEKPTVSAARGAQDSNLTTWDPDVDAGYVVAVNVDSCATFEVATVTFRLEPR